MEVLGLRGGEGVAVLFWVDLGLVQDFVARVVLVGCVNQGFAG